MRSQRLFMSPRPIIFLRTPRRPQSFKILALLCALPLLAAAGDPADSWLSYTAFAPGGGGAVTMLNATWKVPAMPTNLAGSNAPGWWFGVQVWNIFAKTQ